VRGRRHRGSLAVLPALLMLLGTGLLMGCGAGGAADASGALSVVATTSVLADIAQNVAGDRFTVQSLIPIGADPHSYEPAPDDLRRLQTADLVIVNGANLEGTLYRYLGDVQASRLVVASKGLTARMPHVGEPGRESAGGTAGGEGDPHFWLDPLLVKTYVANIASAFARADPAHAAAYRANAKDYDAELTALDRWTRREAASVPSSRRRLVTEHASQGYWADRYGFRVVGEIIPSVNDEAAPTPKQLAALESTIMRDHIPAVFVDVGENPRLARQVAADTGSRVVELYTHSLGEPGSGAATYLQMMRRNAAQIVGALRR
jgi:ABC-type Zn uptake system ZnuABC Zn-binding protein ZnuA